ncbi:MAG: DUF1330 domain-containing protein [Proteobacteria bacterium]|nr:DUF1330 domain-containing protein [Pseudomonadota bacterium]
MITVSSITHSDAFKSAMDNLGAAVASFAGRLVVDVDKPVAWDGTSPVHLVMIRFETPYQAQAWKDSDAFKSFDAALHQSSSSNIQLLQGLPMLIGHGSGGIAAVALMQRPSNQM